MEFITFRDREYMKFGLTEIAVENIRAVFARFPEIEKAILYGSRAKGNFNLLDPRVNFR
jgi:predicted nucleotidyltransferase